MGNKRICRYFCKIVLTIFSKYTKRYRINKKTGGIYILKKLSAAIVAVIMTVGMSSSVFAAETSPIIPETASNEAISPRLTRVYKGPLSSNVWTYVVSDNNLLPVTLNISCMGNPGAFNVRAVNEKGVIIATANYIQPNGSKSLSIPAGSGQYTLYASACSDIQPNHYQFIFSDGWA